MRHFVTVLKFAPTTEGSDQYVMSDGQPDRTEDVIEPSGWVIGDLIPALFNHIKTEVVGRWENVRVIGRQLVGRLVLAEEGTSPTVNMVRALVRQGLLDGVSVGFRPLEKAALDPRDPWFGPQRYIRSELLECSLVAVAANPRARRIIKEFLADGDDRLFTLPRQATRPANVKKGAPMKISERIVERERALVTINDKLANIARRIEGNDEDISDADSDELETLQAEKADATKQLDRLKSLETDIAGRVHRDRNDDSREIVLRDDGDHGAFREAARNAKGFDEFIRLATCHAFSYIERKPVQQVMQERYGRHRKVKDLELVLKATSAPAMTTVVGWAAELVGANVAALMKALEAVAIYPKLAARGQSFTFEGGVPIVVPSRQYGTVPGSATSTGRDRRLSGAFVGEGQAIPVRQGLFKSQTLSPFKMAVISTFTKEMASASTPAMEQIIKQAILEDTAWALDMALLSDEAAIPGIRPAGIFAGVTGLTPAAAGPGAPLADLKALLSAVITAGGGRSIVFILNPLQVLSLSTIVDGGVFLYRDEVARGQLLGYGFISSITVPPGEVYCIDAADFASGTGQPAFDVSDQATLHMDDGTYPAPFTAPTVLPIIDAAGTEAKPVRSLWQTASIGVRMIMPTSWALLRPGMVAHMEGVNW